MTVLSEKVISSPGALPDPTETVADLLERLGNIPAGRVRLHPAPGTATVADVIQIEVKEKRLFELIDGVLVEKAMGYWESYLASQIITMLNIWVMPRKLGAVAGEAGMLQVLPEQVRIPDVSFTKWEHIGEQQRKDKVPGFSPDLAVEVLSEKNTKAEIERKRREYFQGGTQLVWVVDGKTKTVEVFNSPDVGRVFEEGDFVDGGEVLPGFTLSLADLFAQLPR